MNKFSEHKIVKIDGKDFHLERAMGNIYARYRHNLRVNVDKFVAIDVCLTLSDVEYLENLDKEEAVLSRSSGSETSVVLEINKGC